MHTAQRGCLHGILSTSVSATYTSQRGTQLKGPGPVVVLPDLEAMLVRREPVEIPA